MIHQKILVILSCNSVSVYSSASASDSSHWHNIRNQYIISVSLGLPGAHSVDKLLPLLSKNRE